LYNRAEHATVGELDQAWLSDIIERLPAQYRNIDPSSEDDDLKRKVMQAKLDHVNKLKIQVSTDYHKALKRQQSIVLINLLYLKLHFSSKYTVLQLYSLELFQVISFIIFLSSPVLNGALLRTDSFEQCGRS
jgi:hypothetical protein